MENKVNEEKKGIIAFTPRPIEEVTKSFGIFGRVNVTVFVISAIICIGFAIWAVLNESGFTAVINAAQAYTLNNWGWLYMLLIFAEVVILIALAASKYGNIKFGRDDEVPEYGKFSWFSMLFGCGMGIGLVFWAVAEPIYHYLYPPTYAGLGASTQSAEWSMAVSFFHWGISAWAIYTMVGVGMGLIIYRKGLPALMSSFLYPIIGDKIYGPIGKLVDIVTLCMTFFGVSTTIGFGVTQLSSGLSVNYGFEIGPNLYIIVLIICCIGYLASATLPIDKGIKVGSNVSMICTIFIMVFLFVLGPTRYILNNFVNATGIYIQNFIAMSMWTDPVEQTGWLGGWSIFYWAWWTTWCPYVGMFIAKISKGRTIREFIIASLIAPTLFDMIFFSIFGSTALNFELVEATRGVINDAINADVSSAIYVLLEQFPIVAITAPLLIFISYTFFVVSADSSCIVLGMFSTGGDENPKTSIKILWGVSLAVYSGVLVCFGGLAPLQTVTIVAVLPFIVVLIIMIYSIMKILKYDPHYVDNSHLHSSNSDKKLDAASASV